MRVYGFMKEMRYFQCAVINWFDKYVDVTVILNKYVDVTVILNKYVDVTVKLSKYVDVTVILRKKWM